MSVHATSFPGPIEWFMLRHHPIMGPELASIVRPNSFSSNWQQQLRAAGFLEQQPLFGNIASKVEAQKGENLFAKKPEQQKFESLFAGASKQAEPVNQGQKHDEQQGEGTWHLIGSRWL